MRGHSWRCPARASDVLLLPAVVVAHIMAAGRASAAAACVGAARWMACARHAMPCACGRRRARQLPARASDSAYLFSCLPAARRRGRGVCPRAPWGACHVRRHVHLVPSLLLPPLRCCPVSCAAALAVLQLRRLRPPSLKVSRGLESMRTPCCLHALGGAQLCCCRANQPMQSAASGRARVLRVYSLCLTALNAAPPAGAEQAHAAISLLPVQLA
jgi:hypothetical protein